MDSSTCQARKPKTEMPVQVCFTAHQLAMAREGNIMTKFSTNKIAFIVFITDMHVVAHTPLVPNVLLRLAIRTMAAMGPCLKGFACVLATYLQETGRPPHVRALEMAGPGGRNPECAGVPHRAKNLHADGSHRQNPPDAVAHPIPAWSPHESLEREWRDRPQGRVKSIRQQQRRRRWGTATSPAASARVPERRGLAAPELVGIFSRPGCQKWHGDTGQPVRSLSPEGRKGVSRGAMAPWPAGITLLSLVGYVHTDRHGSRPS